jgi:MscS family membrane protein
MDEYITQVPGWEQSVAGFNQGTLALLAILLLAGILVRALVIRFLPTLLAKWCDSSPIADKTIRHSSGALGTAFGAGLFWQATLVLVAGEKDVMPTVVATWLPPVAHLLMLAALILCAFRLTSMVLAVVEFWDDDDELDGTERTLISAMESVLRFLIVIFGSVFIADALRFDLTTLIAGLGISGLALALAAKDSISNMFGAITVLLDRPFKVGDWVVVGGDEGEVVSISLRTTLLRTSIDTIITLPNASLTTKSIENYGKRRWRRYTPSLYLDLESDPKKIKKFCIGVEKLIANHESATRVDASYATVTAIAKDSIEVGCNLYWDVSGSTAERRARQEWLLDVVKLANSCKIKFFEPRVRNQRSS